MNLKIFLLKLKVYRKQKVGVKIMQHRIPPRLFIYLYKICKLIGNKI